jgi:hypothetical protein
VTDDVFVFGGDATDIPPGTYPATLTSLTVKTSDAFGDFRAWDFTLDSGSIVGGASSMATSAKSKGGQWAIALLGNKPDKGQAVQLVGRKCLVVVELDAKDWPKVTNVLPTLADGATPKGRKAPGASTEPTGVYPDDPGALPF